MPTVTALSPTTITAHSAAFSLTVHGSNFVRASVVKWNGSKRATTFINGSLLTAHIRASDVAMAGQATVTVFNPSPGGGTSGPLVFIISASNPVPAANTLSLNIMTAPGPAFTLTVNGSNFVPASVVKWNGSSRATTFINSSQLAAQIGAFDVAAAGQAEVTVFTPSPGGGTSGALAFTILSPIAFDSNRALDGSDAVAAVYNIWVAQGFNAMPLTNLSKLGADSGFPIWSPDGRKIAFESRRALDGSDAPDQNSIDNIWVMNADRSGATPLTMMTASNSSCFYPQWSPDGSKIAFESTRALDGSDASNANNTYNIWVMDADGSGVTPLTRLTANNASSFNPHWSPDGRKIVFHSMRALDRTDQANTNQTFNIWLVNADDPDGSSATPLTILTANGASSVLPMWSPDGSRIAFESPRVFDGSDAANTNQTYNVWLMNADGAGATPLTTVTASGASADFPPVWSPDGSKIAFEAKRALDGSDRVSTNNTSNIWVVKADGTGAAAVTRFTAPNAFIFVPAWSPDGERIAFVANIALDGLDALNTNKAINLWVVNADGTGAIPLSKLTAASVDTEDPAWQP
jgi:Tol biopolymer transport system component